MSPSQKVSTKLTSYIQKQLPEKTATELEQIQYGLQVICINLFDIPIVIVLSLILGIFKYAMASMLAFCSIRCVASGIHARKTWTCLLASLLVFLGIPYLALILKLNILYITLIFIICLILLIIYAPADTEEKPFVSKKLRTKLKKASIIISFIMYFLSIAIYQKYPCSIYSNILILSLFTECLLITPFIYKLMGRRYKNYEYYTNGIC